MRLFSNAKISTRIVVGFIVTALITAVVGYLGVSGASRLNDMLDGMYADQLIPITEVAEADMAALSHNNGVCMYLLDSRGAELSRIKKELEEHEAELKKRVAAFQAARLSSEERAAVAKVDAAWQTYRTAADKAIRLVDSGHRDQAALLLADEVQPAFTVVDKLWGEVTAARHKSAKDSYEESDKVVSRASWTAIGVTVFGAIAAIGFGLWLGRMIGAQLRKSVSELREGAEQVASASGQVATSAQALSQGATEQAASLEETSASMEEMASMTRRNAESSQQAAALMSEAETRVTDSNHAIASMLESMTSITESSNQVSKIIKTIDEIAFQTNILALNAAVEAARAGEAGMGFAVVADEVRNLAQRSAQAAKDTAALIEQSITRSGEGSAKVQHVAESIQAITESVTKVKGLVDEVSVASREQAQGIDQVSQAIAQMEKVTQTTAATAEESAAASEELSAQAETSLSVVAELEQLVHGANATPARAAAAKVIKHRPAPASVARTRSQPMATQPDAEDQLPMTGTYGRF